MPKYQATAYIRLSYTDDRSSESDSVTNQWKLIENFIERNPDIQIVSEKIDDGYSGIIFDRLAFKEMMQDITDGKINCVIVKDLSPPWLIRKTMVFLMPNTAMPTKRIAENAKESIRVLKEKLADVLENRSERNRWISHFTQFSTMEALPTERQVEQPKNVWRHGN